MRRLLALLLVSMAFISCAGTRAARIQDEKISDDELTAGVPPAIDRVRDLVKAGGKEIEKYFVTDENGVISVKADFREDNAEFEIRYNLGVPGFPPGKESIRVDFSVEDKQTGERRDDYFQWQIREDAAGILLAFDDDYMQAWEDSFDVLDKYGARVTYFVQGELTDFCFRAMNRGHDIGYHTINHLNLPRISEEEFYIETTSDIESFRQAGIPLLTFAYPFGLSEPWMREALADTFVIQRGFGATFRLYTGTVVREGYIIARSIDNILFEEEEAFKAMISGMFGALKFIGGDLVLPITTHNISDTAQWGIKPSRLEYLLETANFFKLKFYRYTDFTGG